MVALVSPLHAALVEVQMATAAFSPAPEKLFVGRDTAADMLDVSTRTIDDAIRAGELEVYRIGRRVLIRKDSLIQLAKRVPA